MKKLIFETSPEHKSIFYLLMLLLVSFLLFVFTIVLLLSDLINFIIILKAAGAFGIELLIFLYLLDEILWQTGGTERIEYDSIYLYIEKKRKIFGRHTKIKWNDIVEIAPMKGNFVWNIISYITVTGISQDRISIFLKNKKEISCGSNLRGIDYKEAMETMQELKCKFNK